MSCRRLEPPKVLLLALLALLGPVPCAQALPTLEPQPVYRCIGPDGSAMFSGTPCSVDALARQPLPMAGQGPSPAHVCALEASELDARVTRAFLDKDVNQLSGLMLWQDYSPMAALATMRTLAIVMRVGLAGVAIERAQPPPAAAALDPSNAPAQQAAFQPASGSSASIPVQLEVRLEDGRSVAFGIVSDHGCWWLEP